MTSVVHPRVRPDALEERLYQERIAAAAVDQNTLVVLPTGLGKTAIALRVVAEWLRREPEKSVLFLAPTRPLVLQHADSVRQALFSPPVLVLTGTVEPARRARELAPPQVIVATPQVIENDLTQATVDLRAFSLIVFDEAHRAVGDYPYVAIGEANRDGPRARVLAMTASPGSRIERIRAVWAALGIQRFEYRTADDPDVRPYVHGIGVESVPVPVPAPLQHAAIRLRSVVARQVEELVQKRFLPATAAPSRRDLLPLGERLRGELDRARRSREPVPPAVWAGVTAHSVAMKALHALELAESQGAEQLRSFLDAQASPKAGRITPAQRRFLADPDVVEVRELLRSTEIDLPKTDTAVRLLREELARAPAARVIVFTQYRDTADAVVRAVDAVGDPALRPARFVGQSSRGDDAGLSQREQGAILDRFRAGDVNVLVATSVAEEGLDIPSTDLVIFYEPVSDIVRTIQRRGRTGRVRTGRAVVLVSAGTRDEGVHRAASSRERRMHEMLEKVELEARTGTLAPPPRRNRQTVLPDAP